MFGFWPTWAFVYDVWNKKKTSTYSSTVINYGDGAGIWERTYDGNTW